MKKRYALVLFLLFSYLLLSPETALASAREGLLLWYRSIVPVLFPFMLLCNLAIRLQALDSLLGIFGRPVCMLFGCSRYGAFAVLAGFLCGFPMGAKITHDLNQQQLISDSEAAYLYGFVNNLSPAFLLSFVAADQMRRPDLKAVVTGNILGASLLYGVLSSLPFRRSRKRFPAASLPSESAASPHTFSFFILDECISDATANTVRLGAYILIFSILTGAAERFLPAGHPFALLSAAAIEVTNGVRILSASALPFPLKFLLINGICTFGGFSALAQSVGIAKMSRVQILSYIKSRVCATLLSLLLSSGALLSGFLFP